MGDTYTPTANYRIVASRIATAWLAPALLTTLQPFENLVVNAMHRGGKVLVNELR